MTRDVTGWSSASPIRAFPANVRLGVRVNHRPARTSSRKRLLLTQVASRIRRTPIAPVPRTGRSIGTIFHTKRTLEEQRLIDTERVFVDVGRLLLLDFQKTE